LLGLATGVAAEVSSTRVGCRDLSSNGFKIVISAYLCMLRHLFKEKTNDDTIVGKRMPEKC
jgi:hypothetical protein